MKIILQSKTWKNFKRLLVKGLIFNNKPKIREILLGFCQGTQGDANFWVGLKKNTSSLQHYCSGHFEMFNGNELNLQT